MCSRAPSSWLTAPTATRFRWCTTCANGKPQADLYARNLGFFAQAAALRREAPRLVELLSHVVIRPTSACTMPGRGCAVVKRTPSACFLENVGHFAIECMQIWDTAKHPYTTAWEKRRYTACPSMTMAKRAAREHTLVGNLTGTFFESRTRAFIDHPASRRPPPATRWPRPMAHPAGRPPGSTRPTTATGAAPRPAATARPTDIGVGRAGASSSRTFLARLPRAPFSRAFPASPTRSPRRRQCGPWRRSRGCRCRCRGSSSP